MTGKSVTHHVFPLDNPCENFPDKLLRTKNKSTIIPARYVAMFFNEKIATRPYHVTYRVSPRGKYTVVTRRHGGDDEYNAIYSADGRHLAVCFLPTEWVGHRVSRYARRSPR